MDFIAKIFTFFLTSILIIVTSFFLFSQLNFPNNYKVLLVQSGSMAPSINTGDLIIIKPVLLYQKGDIVTFLSKNGFNITHRIVEIKDNKITTKGDANSINDQESTDQTQVLGKVFYIIPYLGYLIIFIKTTVGLITLIIIPSLIIIFQEIIQIKKNFKKLLKR